MPQRPSTRLLLRRSATSVCERIPLPWLLRLRSAYVDEHRSAFGRRCRRALLEVVRLRGIPQQDPFRVPGHPTMWMAPADSRIASYLFWLGLGGHEAGGPAWWASLVASHRSTLEIGANVGVYTLVGAAAAPGAPYLAVEPNPASFDALRRNVGLNRLDHVEVRQAAVVGGRDPGEVTLSVPARDPYGASSGAFVEGALDVRTAARHTVMVPSVTMGDLVDGVDLVKLDIEGLEAEVLGAVRPWIVGTRPTIVVEVRRRAGHLQRFLGDLLADTDYACYAVVGGRPAKVPPSAVTEGRLERDYATRDVTLMAPDRAAVGRAADREEPVTGRSGRRRLVAFHRSVLPRFRRRRMRLLVDALRVTPSTRVLDVGGTARNWALLDAPPSVTVVNLDQADVVADGRWLPFRDACVDVVFSNSTIEHVGSLDDQRRFAAEIARVGAAYFVQTPNRYFPLEPHLLTPLVQFLPRRARLRLARNFTVWGWLTRPSPTVVADRVGRIRLLGAGDMRALFPGAQLHCERWLGVTKSLVAISGGPGSAAHEGGTRSDAAAGR